MCMQKQKKMRSIFAAKQLKIQVAQKISFVRKMKFLYINEYI